MMDAVEFLRAKARMCNGTSCGQCDLYNSEIEHSGVCCDVWSRNNPEKVVAFMERWAKEHPVKTRQSEFLEQWPEADIDDTDGCLTLKPSNFYKKMRKECVGKLCSECRREFWLTEVE